MKKILLFLSILFNTAICFSQFNASTVNNSIKFRMLFSPGSFQATPNTQQVVINSFNGNEALATIYSANTGAGNDYVQLIVDGLGPTNSVSSCHAYADVHDNNSAAISRTIDLHGAAFSSSIGLTTVYSFPIQDKLGSGVTYGYLDFYIVRDGIGSSNKLTVIVEEPMPTSLTIASSSNPNGNLNVCEGGNLTLTASEPTTPRASQIIASNAWSYSWLRSNHSLDNQTAIRYSINGDNNWSVSPTTKTVILHGLSPTPGNGPTLLQFWQTRTTTYNNFANSPFTVSRTIKADQSGVNVGVIPAPDFPFAFPPDNAVCVGGNVGFSVSGNYSGAWSISDAQIASLSASGNSATVTGVSSGIAVVKYTITGANGCTASAPAEVTVNALPTVAVNSATICAGNSATLTASGASEYNWSPATGLSATTGATVVASPSQTTTYTVTGTDINGCVGQATSTVTVEDCCPQTCYWTLNGNNILGNEENAKNIFGTTSEHQVRIKTSNQDRGIITRDGRLGWNTKFDLDGTKNISTLFHINCAPASGTEWIEDLGLSGRSSIRFENLQETDRGYSLVVNDEGYLFRTRIEAGSNARINNTAIKELQEKNDLLQQQINELKTQLAELMKVNKQFATLNGNENKLMQNSPNPFNTVTKIEYVVTSEANNYITVSNLEGKPIKTVKLTGKGKGIVELSAGTLSSGTYTYSLYANGNLVDTKLMVISK